MMQPLDTPRGMFTARRRARRAAACRAATSRARGWCRSSRRRTWPAGACGRWSNCAASSTSPQEAGLRLHMDGARLMNAVVASGVPGGRVHARLRHRVAGLHEGPRRTTWSVPRGLGGADRGGVALQADAGRRAAPGRDRRRGRAVRARPPRRSAGGRPRERPHAGGAGSRRCPAITLDPDEVETNIVIFEVDDPEGLCSALQRDGVLMGPVGPRSRPRGDSFGCRRGRGTTCRWRR